MPHLSDEDMSHAAWSAQIAAHLEPEFDPVVGHSFGGSTFLKMLTEADLGIARLVLLAAPDWGPDGWDVADYALPDDADQRLDPALRIALHHCRDDDDVPVDHLELLAVRLPNATVVRHRHGGHQFERGAIEAVVRTLGYGRPMSHESDLEALRGQAIAAYQQGRPTFVARLKLAQWGSPAGEISTWMDSVDAVEANGWVLDQWSVNFDSGGTFNAFPLFRRRENFVTQDRT
jgi:predicted alpha/beta hydrolase family esterase